MSKKKAFSGSTMTLKDFHGGSIPSDLPLPSAPGVVVRPSDRPCYQTSWGNPIGRSDHRLRPGSSGATRTFDGRTPFLTHTAYIGRNFDEDERTPLDGISAPRRTVSDESTLLPLSSSRGEVNSNSTAIGRFPSGPVSTAVTQLSSNRAGPYSVRIPESSPSGVKSPNIGVNIGQSAVDSLPNAWVARKEVMAVTEPVPSAWSGQSQVSVSKFAHASALEKVSSGRWQSKPSTHINQADVEVIRLPESESTYHSKPNEISNSYNRMDLMSGREHYEHDATLARHAERVLSVEEAASYDRVRSPLYVEARDRNPSLYADGNPVGPGSKSGVSELQQSVPSEAMDLPKLNVLARSKPVESLESPVIYSKQVRQPSEAGHLNVLAEHRDGYSVKQGFHSNENGIQIAAERPRLNLKPRSQHREQSEGNAEKERNALFGGARPRELVLKERGVDDVVVNNHDRTQPPSRAQQEVPKPEAEPIHSVPTRHKEKADDNLLLDHRNGKNAERRDNRVEVERVNTNKKTWRNENWRNNNREVEKQNNHQQQERPPSPDTWRKPVEEPKPLSPDSSGVRFGKAASAVELAQAFSRSVSDPKSVDRYPIQRPLPGRAQMPFSRLTSPDPTRRLQINGC